MATHQPDPRRAPRAPITLQAELAVGGASWHATLVNLSAAGCAVVSGHEVAPGTELVLLVRPPGEPGVLGVEGRVVRRQQAVLGIRFGRTLTGEQPAAVVDRLLSVAAGMAPAHRLALRVCAAASTEGVDLAALFAAEPWEELAEAPPAPGELGEPGEVRTLGDVAAEAGLPPELVHLGGRRVHHRPVG